MLLAGIVPNPKGNYMLNAIKQRLAREDEGFTLIELMVVVLIIAILLAIAIPTFLGARNSANARSAQSNLRNALTAEQVAWTNGQSFSNTSATMQGIESALVWNAAVAPTAGNNVSVDVGDADTAGNDQAVMLEAFSKDGNCYFILQSNDPANSFTGYAAIKQDAATHACVAPAVPAPLPASLAATGTAGGNVGPSGAVPTTFYKTF
jgi:type IV pilus assembly protein PilA